MRKHSVKSLTSLALAIYLIAPWKSGQCDAGGIEATCISPSSVCSTEVGEFPDGAGTDEDVFTDFMTAISQWIDKALASDLAGNTSFISTWNH